MIPTKDRCAGLPFGNPAHRRRGGGSPGGRSPKSVWSDRVGRAGSPRRDADRYLNGHGFLSRQASSVPGVSLQLSEFRSRRFSTARWTVRMLPVGALSMLVLPLRRTLSKRPIETDGPWCVARSGTSFRSPARPHDGSPLPPARHWYAPDRRDWCSGLSYVDGFRCDHPATGANAALRHYSRSLPEAGGYRVMAIFSARANRTGTVVLVLTLVGLATGSAISLTTSASAATREFVPMTTFNGVACASAHQCIGVGNATPTANSGAAVPLNPVSGALSTGKSLQLIRSSGFLNGVSCPSGSACLAVGENPDESRGVAVPLNPATAMVRSGEEVHSISGIFMSGVACASREQCLAVGHDSSGSGVAVALSPATGAIVSGRRVQTIPGTGGVGLEGVACPTSKLCVAVGENSGRSAGVAVPLDPATGAVRRGRTVQEVTHKGILVDLACPSTTVCLAVGWGASQPSVAVPIDPRTGALSPGQSDRSISARPAMLTAVSCPSPSSVPGRGRRRR